MQWGMEANVVYSESSVIRTSIIRILDYPDHKITVHMTRRLGNYCVRVHVRQTSHVLAVRKRGEFLKQKAEDLTGVATKVNVCTVCMYASMYECMLVYNVCVQYVIVFHLSELFTYLNKILMALDQWGSDNRGFTV